MTDTIISSRTGSVAVIRLQSPPVNALSRTVRMALYEAVQRAHADPEVQALVLAGGVPCFSAGADIAEFRSQDEGAMFAGRDPADLVALLEGLSKPVVAAIEGMALGGGLELALGCHARMASGGASFGLPEIRLGVIPGAGGTQRLPRLIGLDAAMRLMLSGEPVRADRALALGLVDRVVPTDAVSAAVAHAAALADSGPLRRTSALPLRDPDSVHTQQDAWQTLMRKTKAPLFAARQLLACAEDTVQLPFAAALQAERARFEACNRSDSAAGLQHAFFATREAARLPQSSAPVQRRTIERVVIVGGGTMGRGIAMAMANGGHEVTIVETDAQRAGAALDAVHSEYQGLVSSGRIEAELARRRSARIQASPRFDAVAQADLVIEAVFENLEIKRDVCRRLGQACRPGAIIASNTSTLDIDLLARDSGRPEDFLGLHFFSPAHVMRLVEVVRGARTRGDVLATAMDLVRRLGKTPVVSGVCDGFIGNRMLEPYLRETEALLLEGCTPAQIDAALERFGMAMGPCRMMDLAGVDVVAKVVEEREKQGLLPGDPRYRIVCRELAAIGRFGQKSGLGFYAYEGRRPVEDAGALAAIRALAGRQQVPQRQAIDAREIVERCLLPLINEGFRIVEEGIAVRESDVDVVWLSGYGFPGELGGPLFHARQAGLQDVADRLAGYAERQGNAHGYWTLAGTLRAAAQACAEVTE